MSREKKKQHPFMPLFMGDLVGATADWDGEATALYLLLLGYQWTLKSLPADPRSLCKLVRWDLENFARFWPRVSTKFIQVDDRIFNERLEIHRAKSDAIAKKNSTSGKKGGEAKERNKHKASAQFSESVANANRGAIESARNALGEMLANGTDSPPISVGKSPEIFGSENVPIHPIPSHPIPRVQPGRDNLG